MSTATDKNDQNLFIRLLTLLLGGPWLEVLAEMLKWSRKYIQGLAEEGMYEVLAYEATLELKDKRGKKATFHKRQRVRYVQNNIIAYQDQAWGDGEFLTNYHCSPGKMVDSWREGHKTFILISLRELRQRGETDEYNIEWEVNNGFLKPYGYWETAISHRTKVARVTIIFPESRPPQKAIITEATHRNKQELPSEAIRQLADGRWQISWEKHKPRLYERYIVSWDW